MKTVAFTLSSEGPMSTGSTWIDKGTLRESPSVHMFVGEQGVRQSQRPWCQGCLLSVKCSTQQSGTYVGICLSEPWHCPVFTSGHQPPATRPPPTLAAPPGGARLYKHCYCPLFLSHSTLGSTWQQFSCCCSLQCNNMHFYLMCVLSVCIYAT